MDAYDKSSSIDTFEEFMAQEDLCADLANTRLREISEHINKSEDILNNSRNCIEESFKNIRLVLEEMKKEFVMELEEAVKAQQSTLLQERDSLIENIKKFTKFMFTAKINVKACQDSQREKTALYFLNTLAPIVQTLLEESSYHPITFVTNKDFLKCFFTLEDKHKIGYIRYLAVDNESLKLEPQDLRPSVGSSAKFLIRTSSNHDLDGLHNYFSWKVVAEDKIIKANFNIVDNTFIFQFPVSKNVPHEVNFFLFNQNISGSPCTIVPVFTQEKSIFHADKFENNPKIVPEKMKPLEMLVKDPVKLVDRSSSSIKPPRALDHKHKSEVMNVDSSTQLTGTENMLENLDMHTSPSNVAQVLTKFVDQTTCPVQPPKAISQHNSGLSVDMDLVNDVNCMKEFAPNGHVKLSEKLIDRSVKINKAATIRKPFSSIKNIENKVNKKGNSIQNIKTKNSMVSEFKPLFSSTSEVKAACASISMANMSSFDNTMEPGQKTLLLDECILKTPHSAISHENLNIEEDLNNNCIPKKQGKNLERNNDKELIGKEDKFHTFLKCDLIAKCQACFEGNDKVQMKFPIGIAELFNGNIVVADTFNDRLLLFSKDAIFIREFSSSKRLSQPSAIDILPDGHFAVRDNHSIITFSELCEPLNILGLKFLTKPYGITHDSHGNIITIDVNPNGSFSIVRIDPSSGNLLSRVIANIGSNHPDSKLTKPRFITFREPNELLVVDLGLDYVYIFKMSTGHLVNKFGGSGTAPGKFRDPSGIACDAEGYMFIGDSRNHRIQVFSPEGHFVCILKLDRPLKRPSGLHLTPAGQLYVLNYWENSFVKYIFASTANNKNDN